MELTPEEEVATAKKKEKREPPTWLEYFKAFAGSGGTLILGVAALIWSIYSFGIQQKHLQNQLEMQQKSFARDQDQDRLKLLIALLPYLSCETNERREMSLEALKIYAPEELRLVVPIVEKCAHQSKEVTDHLERIREQGALDDLERQFIQLVNNGRQFHYNGLEGAAARTFTDASNFLPQSYLTKQIVDSKELEAARKAFYDGEFSEASDRFMLAFKKVPDDLDKVSNAFRRGPTP